MFKLDINIHIFTHRYVKVGHQYLTFTYRVYESYILMYQTYNTGFPAF